MVITISVSEVSLAHRGPSWCVEHPLLQKGSDRVWLSGFRAPYDQSVAQNLRELDFQGVGILYPADKEQFLEAYPGQSAQSMSAAKQWHPERPANDEAHAHLATHYMAENLLTRNPELAVIAKDAEANGADPHEVRHALGRAFLQASFLAKTEGDPHKFGIQWIAQEFKRQLDPGTA